MTPDPHWRDDALCRETDATLFFPTKGDPLVEARRLCGMCPVRDDCLEDALRQRDYFGFRGGLSGQQRRRLASGRERPNPKAEIVRLYTRRWTPRAIGLRLGMNEAVVYRELKRHREAGEVA